MDKIEKLLRKLTEKERGEVKGILLQLRSGGLRGLDVKKLKGRNDIFRIRKGDIRIIYRTFPNEGIFVLSIERRSEKTYKKF